MEYTEQQIQQGLNNLPKEQKMFLLESLRKERLGIGCKAWTKITIPEFRILNLVEKQIELLEKEDTEEKMNKEYFKQEAQN